MGNGFQTSRPARPGANVANSTADRIYTQRFQHPGTNGVNYEVTEVGWYASADAAKTGLFRLAIFDHDAVNGCPSTIVANSDAGEISVSDVNILARYGTIGTKPIVVGQSYYWLAMFQDDVNINWDYVATTGGTSMRQVTETYPTWPTDTEWHTHVDTTTDMGAYAVYQAIAGGVYPDSWHPEIQQPIRERIEVIGY
jgi:hypothetical protein